MPTTMREVFVMLLFLDLFFTSGKRQYFISCYALEYAAILGSYFSIGDRKILSLNFGRNQSGRSFQLLLSHLYQETKAFKTSLKKAIIKYLWLC